MSVINVISNNIDDDLQVITECIQQHYFDTVSPNTNVEYTTEDDEVYLQRILELMQNELCSVELTKQGFSIDFDTTEDAGFSIASEVYHTSMGYSDNGLIYLEGLFKNIIDRLPNIKFDADLYCADKWDCFEGKASYDGNEFIYETDEESYEDETEDYDDNDEDLE